MSDEEWDPAKIQEIASASGKQLEVACAQAFLAVQAHQVTGHHWAVHLGSYYPEPISEVLREVDVVAVAQKTLPRTGAPFILRAVISCRGFPPSRRPLTYSLTPETAPSSQPAFSSSKRPRTGNPSDSIPELARNAAKFFIKNSGLGDKRIVVALDIVERKETQGKTMTYGSNGDKTIYTALDSAFKASLAWAKADVDSGRPHYSVMVPVCLLSKPMWDVCIDGGKAALPELRTYAYETNSYLIGGDLREATIVLCSASNLPKLIADFEDLFERCYQFVCSDEETRGL